MSPKNPVVTLCLFLVPLFSICQNLELKNIKTPNSPGFQILDISPENIERPTNPKAFATSLYGLAGSGNAFPKNFAFELAPYWFTKPTDATVYKYLNIQDEEGHKNIFNGIYNKLSVSIASSYSDSNNAFLLKNNNYLSTGLRTNLITFRSREQNKGLSEALTRMSKIMGEVETESETKKDKLKIDFVLYQKEISELESLAMNEVDQSKRDSLNARIKELVKLQIQTENEILGLIKPTTNEVEVALDKNKEFQDNLKKLEALPLFQFDAAFAYSIALPDNSFTNQRFHRTALWTNATVNGQFDKNDIQKGNFFGMLYYRHMWDNLMTDTVQKKFDIRQSNDIGFKIGLESFGFTISYEYISRYYKDITSLNSQRSVASLQYKLSEGLSVYGSFGETFSMNNVYFSTFGLNWGFGKTEVQGKGSSN